MEGFIEHIWTCKNCGSINVEHRVWRKLNEPDKISGEISDDEDTWCNSCEQHAGVELVEVHPELARGSIIKLNQTVNGCDTFVIPSIKPLTVIYDPESVKNTREYEYSIKELLERDKLTGEFDYEVIDNIFEIREKSKN